MNLAQLRALLWLRWRLTRNQWARGGEINAVITVIALWIALCMAVVAGAGGAFAGALGLAKASPQATMLVWDVLIGVFLLFWMIGIVTELQRAELIDFGRLLYLPVSLRCMFLLNYAASHFSFSLAFVLPAMLGITAGLVLGRGLTMVLLLPLLLGFFFMVTAWTYCLRGWLASLMVNQRRRRSIIVGVTVTFILLAQLPNLVMQVWMGHTKKGHRATLDQPETHAQLLQASTWAHRIVPVLWVPLGARCLAEGSVWPALLGFVGLSALGAAGLRRAYQSTVRFHQGGASAKPGKMPAAPVLAPARPFQGTLLVERKLPVIPEEAAAMALANFRSMIRAPEVKMALGMNVMVLIIMGAVVFSHNFHSLPKEGLPFLASGAVAVTFFGMIQLLANQFGFDRDGFRVLVLLPTRRDYFLLGKNVSVLPFALGSFLIFLVMLAVLAHLPVWTLLASGLQFAGAFLGLSTLGSFLSIVSPFRIAPGSLKPTKTKATAMLVTMFTQMLFPLAMVPIFIPAALGALGEHFGLPGAPITLMLSGALAALGFLLYWRALEPLGRLLQRREQKLLLVVTQEVE